MIFSRMNKRQYKYIALSASVILLLYLIFTPLIYNQSGEVISGRSSRSVRVSEQNPIKQNKKVSYITAAITENLMMPDAVIYHIVSRNQQESRQVPNLVYYALAILLSGYGILIHNSRCIKHRSSQHTRVLAGSLGGHAPPLS